MLDKISLPTEINKRHGIAWDSAELLDAHHSPEIISSDRVAKDVLRKGSAQHCDTGSLGSGSSSAKQADDCRDSSGSSNSSREAGSSRRLADVLSGHAGAQAGQTSANKVPNQVC